MKRSVESPVVLTALGVLLLAGLTLSGNVAAQDGDRYEAEFNRAGELIRPAGWREWIFMGSPLTPNDQNGGEAGFPEFHSVYMDPTSWAHWKETGEFREGTMLAKELTLIGARAASSGNGYFNGELQGFEIAHKDTARYGTVNNGWAYYTFGHKPQPYDKVTAAQPVEACAACHNVNAADDNVFTQYYPIVREAKAAGETGAGTGGN